MRQSLASQFKTVLNATSNSIIALGCQCTILASHLLVTARIQMEFTCKTPKTCLSEVPTLLVVNNYLEIHPFPFSSLTEKIAFIILKSQDWRIKKYNVPLCLMVLHKHYRLYIEIIGMHRTKFWLWYSNCDT